MEEQTNAAPPKKEVVVIQNLAEVDVNNSKALLLVDTQTFTIEYLDEPGDDIEIKKSPSSRHSPLLHQINEPTIAEDGEVPHGTSSAECSICGKCYISVQAKKKHELSHFGIKLINCEKCLKYFITSTKYYEHDCIISPRYFICHICKRRYLNLAELQCHEIAHTKLLPHRCDNCRQCFSHLNSKKNHICHSYLPYSMYFCNKCSTAFKTYKGLIIHYLEHLVGELPSLKDISDSVILEYWQKFAIKEPNREKSFARFFKTKAAEKRKIDNLYCDADDDASFDIPTIKLKPHNITNSASYTVNCRICGQAYKNKIEKLKHEIEHFTKVKPIKCGRCKKQFLLTSSFCEHGCKSAIVIEKICNICKERTSLSYLKAHEIIHTGEAVCRNTGKSFSECNCGCSKELLTKTFPCNLCKKTFHNMRYLDIHKLYHFIENDDCEIPMIVLHRLIKDKYKVENVSTLNFDTNRSDFLSNESMVLPSDVSNGSQEGHSLTVDPAEPTLNPQHFIKGTSSNVSSENICQICNTKFNTVYDKKLHILKHFGINPYRCELCLRHFALSSRYYSHKCEENALGINSHPIKISFFDKDRVTDGAFCHLCHKKFAGVNKLKRHETVHTNERPYKCTDCNKSFSQWTGRKKHTCNYKKVDTEKVECNKCLKVFRDMMYLSIHEIVHTFDEKRDLNDVPEFVPKKQYKKLK